MLLLKNQMDFRYWVLLMFILKTKQKINKSAKDYFYDPVWREFFFF